MSDLKILQDKIKYQDVNKGPSTPFDSSKYRYDFRGLISRDYFHTYDIKNCELCDFEGAFFIYNDLSGVNFRECNFRNANFLNARLWDADLSFSVVSGAKFQDADLWHCNFTGCDIENTELMTAVTRGMIYHHPLHKLIESKQNNRRNVLIIES